MTKRLEKSFVLDKQLARLFSEPIDQAALSGRWYIIETSLPFWQHRRTPTITYTQQRCKGQPRLLDQVRYLNAAGQRKQIVGYDYALEADSLAKQGHFNWVAQPWYLFFLKSQWGVVAHDLDYSEWAVTYFSKTLFTAAGIDIYSRQPFLASHTRQQIIEHISPIDALQPHIENLYLTNQTRKVSPLDAST